MNSSLTLVTGATGKTGRRIAQLLTKNGHAVRAGSRQADIPFEWNDKGTWNAALDGVTTAYIAYSPDLAIPGATATIADFVERAVQSGVSRLVLLSGRGEAEAQECERLIQREDVQWTVVRASWFSQNFSEGAFVEMVQAGEIALPVGDIQEPFVDADDIAEVAFAALTEDGHTGQVYEVTGSPKPSRKWLTPPAVRSASSRSRPRRSRPESPRPVCRRISPGSWTTCSPRCSTVAMRTWPMVCSGLWAASRATLPTTRAGWQLRVCGRCRPDRPAAGLTSCTSGVHGVQAEGKSARNHRNNVPRVTSLSPSARVSTKLYTPLGASRPAASRPSQGMD